MFVWTLSNRSAKVTFNYADTDMTMEVVSSQDNTYVSPSQDEHTCTSQRSCEHSINGTPTCTVHIHVLHAMLEFPLFIRWLEIHVHALTLPGIA